MSKQQYAVTRTIKAIEISCLTHDGRTLVVRRIEADETLTLIGRVEEEATGGSGR